MFRLAKAILTIAAIVTAMPSVAQAPTPTTTVFDGTYLGMSLKSEGTFGGDAVRQVQGDVSFRGDSHWCGSGGVPLPLTIVNGIARVVWGAGAEGSVSSQGVLVMRTRSGARFDGRIDAKGTVTGRFTGGCSYQLVWQKLPQPTMPLDGDYIGVSKETSKTASAPEKCPPNGVPATLMIRNSIVLGPWQGTVSPKGVLTMRNNTMRFSGEIDSRGTVRGHGANDAGCARTYVWQKERR